MIRQRPAAAVRCATSMPTADAAQRRSKSRQRLGRASHNDEGRDPRRRPRHAALRGDRGPAEADGRDRRPADPLAHHEALRARTGSTSSSSRSATRARSSSATSSTTTRSTASISDRPCATAQRRLRTTSVPERLERPPGRHRRRHEDRRPAEAPARRGSATSTFMLTYGDGVADVDLGAAARVPPRARQARHRHRRPPAGPLRRPRLRRRRCVAEFTEKPQIGEGWINGGFFVFEPRIVRLPRRRRRRAWKREPLERLAAGRRARRLPARRLLAVHGHAARRATCSSGSGTAGSAPWKMCGGEPVVLARPPDLRHRRDRAASAAGSCGGWSTRGADVVCLVRDWVPQSELVSRAGCSTRSRVVRGDVCDQALAGARPRRVRDRHRHPPRGADDRRHRQPQSGLDVRDEHRAAPGRCSRRAAAARRSKQIVVASSDKAYGDQRACCRTTRTRRSRAGTRTTSASRAPT